MHFQGQIATLKRVTAKLFLNWSVILSKQARTLAQIFPTKRHLALVQKVPF
jgi:hypothetical protein